MRVGRAAVIAHPSKLKGKTSSAQTVSNTKCPSTENGLGWWGWRCPWRTWGGRRLHRDVSSVSMNQGSHEAGRWAGTLQGEGAIQPSTVDHHYEIISWRLEKIGNWILIYIKKKKKSCFQNWSQNESLICFHPWSLCFLSFLLSTLQKQTFVWIAAVPFKLLFFAKEIICQRLDENA